MSSPPTIDEIAGGVREALAAEPPRASEAIRVALSLVSVFDHAPPIDREGLVIARPNSTGDPGHDALLASLVEHLCARWNVPTPAWVEDRDRFVEPWWFVSGLTSLHASALAQSPISFARHGVFICDGALSYA